MIVLIDGPGPVNIIYGSGGWGYTALWQRKHPLIISGN